MPCRSSASPIDRRIRAFYVGSAKAPCTRSLEDEANEISVQFQSIANSELWWSNYVQEGNRLGIVARHMSRRTRVQNPKRSARDGTGCTHEKVHGYQGRWFSLVQAPNNLIDVILSQDRAKVIKPLPGAFSLVHIWDAPALAANQVPCLSTKQSAVSGGGVDVLPQPAGVTTRTTSKRLCSFPPDGTEDDAGAPTSSSSSSSFSSSSSSSPGSKRTDAAVVEHVICAGAVRDGPAEGAAER